MPTTLHIEKGSAPRDCKCRPLTTIGRGVANDVILKDSKASRSHAMLRLLGDGRYYLIDLGSANGTRVNGERISVPCPMTDSDEIRIGDHLLLFRHKPDTPDAAPPDDAVDNAPTLLTSGGMVQNITILVADIRGYTPLSERIPVALLAKALSHWLGATAKIVRKNGGVVDKFIGDAVMVRWLTDSLDIAESVNLALRTALDIRDVSSAMKTDIPELPAAFRVGVGINTGQAVLGNVGETRSSEYTALGDAVNLAFHLESASKGLKTDVVVGPDSCAHLPPALWQTGTREVIIKGKEKPLNAWAVTFDELERQLRDSA